MSRRRSRDWEFSKRPPDDGKPAPYTKEEVQSLIPDTLTILAAVDLPHRRAIRALILAAQVVNHLDGGAPHSVAATAVNTVEHVSDVIQAIVKKGKEQVDVQSSPGV